MSKAPGAPSTGDAEPGSASGTDVALVHGVTPDGKGLRVIRKRDERVELGVVQPLKQGVPIAGEVVTLRPRPECPVLCDVTVELAARAQPNEAPREAAPVKLSRSGPAQVATDEYRRHWDEIFARPRNKPELLN